MKLDEVLGRLKGVRACSGYWIALCPGHTDRTASLSIREGESGRVLLRCHAGCSYDVIRYALGGRSLSKARGLGLPAKSPVALDDGKRTELALRVWRETRPAVTLVERYLRDRGITISIPPTIRFHPNLRHPGGTYLPCMVAAVQDADGRIVAIHRTYLKSDGRKADVEPVKAALGPIRGGAVRLAAAAELLALTEGIEDGLSIFQATGIPTWAALGTSNLIRVELPEVVGEVIVCADADTAGERAARDGAARFMREGRRVRIARPQGRKDFNDMRL